MLLLASSIISLICALFGVMFAFISPIRGKFLCIISCDLMFLLSSNLTLRDTMTFLVSKLNKRYALQCGSYPKKMHFDTLFANLVLYFWLYVYAIHPKDFI